MLEQQHSYVNLKERGNITDLSIDRRIMLKLILKERGWKGLVQIQLVQDREQQHNLINMKMKIHSL